MQSYQLQRNSIAGATTKRIILAPTPQNRKEVPSVEFAEGDVFSLDIVLSTGEGIPKYNGEGNRTTVFRKTDYTFGLKTTAAKTAYSIIKKDFGEFPFSITQFEDETKAKMGMTECQKVGLVEPYHCCYEKEGEDTVHVILTVLLMPNGPLKITGVAWDAELVKSEVELKDESIKELLKLPVRNANKKKCMKEAKNGAEQVPAISAQVYPVGFGRPDRPSLTACLTSDVVAGLSTSLLVAPAVAIIDKSIISSASGRSSMMHSLADGFLSLARNPVRYVGKRSVLAVYAIFAGTYVTNNVVETICLHEHVPPTLPKFLLSSAVNVSICAWKDALYTKWYATVAPKPIPRASYALFALRDTMTISTAFVAPAMVSPMLQSEPFRMPKRTADALCQLSLPCLIQFVSAPIHLVSLDLYNHPNSNLQQRMQVIGKQYWGCATLRVFRTLPGFGVGGVANRQARLSLNDFFGNAFDGISRYQKGRV
ncbi:hypothetical protein HDU80_002184 [Chytriomyces hyalinus]|nr:hypothetical protein HDU80_002184 [Chytriomyces hyalinus]